VLKGLVQLRPILSRRSDVNTEACTEFTTYDNGSNCWIKLLFLFCLCTQKVFSSLHNITVEPLILTIFSLLFWNSKGTMTLLPVCGSDTLGFHQKYLNLCSEDERRSYRYGTTWGWVINDRNFIFGWTKYLFQNKVRIIAFRFWPAPSIRYTAATEIFNFFVYLNLKLCSDLLFSLTVIFFNDPTALQSQTIAGVFHCTFFNLNFSFSVCSL